MSNLIFKQEREARNPKPAPYDAFTRNIFEAEMRDNKTASAALVLREVETQPWHLAFDMDREENSVRQKAEEMQRRREQEARDRKVQVVVGPIIAQAQAQADAMIQAAEKQAAQILDAARKRSEELEAEAYQAGFAQGEAAGMQLGEQKIDPVLRNLRLMVEALDNERAAFLIHAEEDMVKAALISSIQIIQREIQQDPSVVLDVVRAAVAKMHQATRITIYVSPVDFKFMEDQLDLVQGMMESGTTVSIEPDSAILRGGCRLASNTGEVDATIDSMIDRLKQRLREEE